MKKLGRSVGRRAQGDRRKGAVDIWREELERRTGPQVRRKGAERRWPGTERRVQHAALARKLKRSRFLGKGSGKWPEVGVPETASMHSTGTMKRVRLCPMVELGRCHGERDIGVYVGGVLAGAITHNNEWHVWRLVDACDVDCASELRMYMDRLRHLAAFPSLKGAKDFVKGPFKRYILAEMKAARVLKTG